MSTGLTLKQLYNRVATNLQDTSFTYWPKGGSDAAPGIIEWINDGMREVCADCQLLKQYVTFGPNPVPVLSSNATAEYVPTLQAGVASPTTPDSSNLDQIIFLQAGNIMLEQVSAAYIADLWWDWDTRTGTPAYVLFNDWAPGVAKIIPDPGTQLSTVRGVATLKPTLLVADGDIPPFDSEYHVLLEYYATARAYLMDSETQDEQKAAVWLARYAAKIARLKAKQGRNFSTAPRAVDIMRF